MTRVFKQMQGGVRFGAAVRLSGRQLARLVAVFENPDPTRGPALGGRQAVSRIYLDGIGPVVVKHYRRGGLVARVIRQTYVNFGKPRSRHEFEQLERVRQLGVDAPEPVAYAFCGTLVYRAWLISREILGAQSLAQLSRTSIERTHRAMDALTRHVAVLVAHGIRHRDFHPGNVLVDSADRVFLIDFDKADRYRGSRATLAGKYVRRWNRAVEKHGLPPVLTERMAISARALPGERWPGTLSPR